MGAPCPGQLYWDEHYYVFDAEAYLGGGFGQPGIGSPPPVRIADEGTWVHPPLGKWMIALRSKPGPEGHRHSSDNHRPLRHVTAFLPDDATMDA